MPKGNGKMDCPLRVEGQLCLVLLLWKLNWKLLELVTYSKFRSDLDQLNVSAQLEK